MALTKFENFLPENLYTECVNAAKFVLNNDGVQFKTNYFWENAIIKDSFPVLIHPIYKENQLYNNLKNIIEEKTKLLVKNHDIMIYFWTRFSYIPWHHDSIYAGALTVYLNENWHEDFGGFFLYQENEEIKAILPKRNLGILQTDGIKHSTTAVNYDGHMRVTIQVFLDKE